jgi:hypothetical protein
VQFAFVISFHIIFPAFTIGLAPVVIVSYGTPLTRQFKAATNTIPIVAYTGDPVRFGLVSSLAHPGGNITGVSESFSEGYQVALRRFSAPVNSPRAGNGILWFIFQALIIFAVCVTSATKSA